MTGLTNYPTPDYTELHRAVVQGCVKKTLKNIGLGVSVNVSSKAKKETPLTLASAHGYKDLVKLLLKHGADTEHVTLFNNWTALFYSIPYPEVMEILLANGANHGARDDSNDTPLHLAIRGEIGDATHDIILLLLKHGADMDARNNTGDAPLHILCHKGRPSTGRIEAANVLLERGADINAMNSQGCTPLMCTCIYVTGLVAMAETLIDAGADVDFANHYGSTSLHLLAAGDKACGSELLDIAALLLKKGACTETVDCVNGSTPLNIACMHVGNLGLVKLLLHHGANVNTTDRYGDSPLHNAASKGCIAIMSLLISTGAEINLRNGRGKTPLLIATLKRHVAAVQMLLRHGASALVPTNREADHEWIPLDVAVQEQSIHIVEALIQHAGVDGCGGVSAGLQSLVNASATGQLRIMSILLDAGVMDNGSALRSATSEGQIKPVQLLLDRRAGDVEQYVNSGGPRYVTLECFSPESLATTTCCKVMRVLLEAGADTAVPFVVEFQDGLKAELNNLEHFADYLLTSAAGPVNERKLCNLKALRRLVMQKEAVTACSWLWPAVSAAAERRIVAASSARTDLTGTVPMLRRRARAHGVSFHSMLRCVQARY